MDDVELDKYAARCARFITFAGDVKGVSERVLRERIAGFDALGSDDRFRVLVRVCKKPGIASKPEWDGTSRGTFRFWPRCYAPSDAAVQRNPNAP